MNNNNELLDKVADDFQQGAYLDQVKEDGMFLKEIPEDKRTLEICQAAVKRNIPAIEFVPDHLLNKLGINAVSAIGDLHSSGKFYEEYDSERTFWKNYFVAKGGGEITDKLHVNNIKRINKMLNSLKRQVFVTHEYVDCDHQGGVPTCELAEVRTRKYMARNIKLILHKDGQYSRLTLLLANRWNGATNHYVAIRTDGYVKDAAATLDDYSGNLILEHRRETGYLSKAARKLSILQGRPCEATAECHEVIEMASPTMEIKGTKIIIRYWQRQSTSEVVIDFSEGDKIVTIAPDYANLSHAGTHSAMAIEDAKSFEKKQKQRNKTGDGMVHWDTKSNGIF
jgi:hypothetical protein